MLTCKLWLEEPLPPHQHQMIPHLLNWKFPGKKVVYTTVVCKCICILPGRHVQGVGTGAPSQGGSPSCNFQPTPLRCARCWGRWNCLGVGRYGIMNKKYQYMCAKQDGSLMYKRQGVMLREYSFHSVTLIVWHCDINCEVWKWSQP